MVKHAARDEEPLLTAEERVGRAFDRLTAKDTFTTEQQRWLERIRQHLIANLSIDEDDFENVPILQAAGGWGNANRAFKGKLPVLLKAFNEAIAA
jgi:type I restriction enzyme R subunit